MAEYIDRKQALMQLMDIFSTEDMPSEKLERYMGLAKLRLYNSINSLPASDVAPVVHAKWIDKGYLECSKCGCLAPCTEFADVFVWKQSNYCPDCGAKMDKE